MIPEYYKVLHIFSLVVLTAHTYMALANPDPANRKRTMMITGIASLLLLFSGFGLLARLHANQFAPWVFVKLACWLGLTALAGLAYRQARLRGLLSFLGLGFVLVAVWTVFVGRL